MFDLPAYLADKRKQIDTALRGLLKTFSNPSRLTSAMEYSLMAGGKRLRPILCISAAEAVGGCGDHVLKAACALEMLHTYSLIHDDLPAMDDDDLRRGKPTCHMAFDEATAILAGDALLTLAFQVLATEGSAAGTDTHKWHEVIRIIARAAGCLGMIEGQMRDMAAQDRPLTLAELEAMHALKTGALIEASVSSGAILADGTAIQIKRLRVYAQNIGLAFQVTDDILNVEGDPLIMGKAVGTDQCRRKSTYPSIMGIEQSKQFAQNLIHNALQVLDAFDHKSGPLSAIANYILERRR